MQKRNRKSLSVQFQELTNANDYLEKKFSILEERLKNQKKLMKHRNEFDQLRNDQMKKKRI